MNPACHGVSWAELAEVDPVVFKEAWNHVSVNKQKAVQINCLRSDRAGHDRRCCGRIRSERRQLKAIIFLGLFGPLDRFLEVLLGPQIRLIISEEFRPFQLSDAV